MILLLELAVEENVHCNCGGNRAEDIRQSISRRIGMKRRAANTSDRHAWACTPAGIEPATYGSEDHRSIQLS
jgi:hypothetical protein